MHENLYSVSTRWKFTFTLLVAISLATTVEAFQDPANPESNSGNDESHQTQHVTPPSGWRVMQDGVVFLTLNDQPKPLDGKELVSQNWWMGMASRPLANGTFMVRGMLSLEPLTMGGDGYGELFQTGETYREQPLVNRQHPHDFVMQLTAAWRRPLSPRTSITVAGGPVGEATLGPVAFMHRLSAAENPFAPLGHHTFDSTHIAKGIIATRVDHGPIAIEGSVFHGRESDEERWGISDVGALDSWATRVWFLPDEHWAFQVSHGFLRTPERLEPGNVRRTTASVSWLSESDARFTALTAGYGHNDKDLAHSSSDAFFVEATRRFSPYVVYSRFEAVDVETELLLKTKMHIDNGHAEPSTVGALTIGALRDLPGQRRFELAIGGDVTVHKVPNQLAPIYGSRPVSFKIFFRLRPPVSPMGRMRNGTMMQPMREHQ
jgi:hypothetical protein